MANQKYEAFLHIAETGSFKQAAHDLGYTQAGISYLISSMERELGIPLFVRDYGGAHLTSEGAELLPWNPQHLQRRASAGRAHCRAEAP